MKGRASAVTIDRAVGLGAVVFALIAPLVLDSFWIGALMTQMLLLGIVAASVILLQAYGGMLSLAQVALFGISGFVVGNATTNGNTKGLNLDWNPWWGVVLGLVIAVAVALVFGLIASRSFGIYFLMITLTFGVIAEARSPTRTISITSRSAAPSSSTRCCATSRAPRSG